MERLPVWIDPIRLADEGARLRGTVPAGAMPRLGAACLDHAAEATVNLVFSRAQDGFRRMQGQVQLPVGLGCERCLKRLDWMVETEVQAVWLRPGQPEAAIPEEYDIMTAAEPVALADLVEDELLLGLPMYPTHPDGLCRAPQPKGDTAAHRPFDVLGKLKGRLDKQ